MESNILTILIFLPLVGISAMIIAYFFKPHDIIYKYIALATTFIQLALTGWLYSIFIPEDGLQYIVRLPWIDNFNIQYFVGIDGLSIPLVLLTSLLMFISQLNGINTTGNSKPLDLCTVIILIALTSSEILIDSLSLALFHFSRKISK